MADNEPDLDIKLDPDPILAPLALIAPAIAIMVTLPLLLAYAAVAAGIALVGAVALGAPVLAAAHRLGFRGFIKTAALGAVTAAIGVFVLGLVVAAVFKQQVQLNTTDSLILASTIGAATGATYATIYDSVNLSPHQVRWRILIIVLVAVTVPFASMVLKSA